MMGNLNKNNIFDIWTGKEFNLAREKLLRADRNFSPCNVCDVRGSLIGSKHADHWTKILDEK